MSREQYLIPITHKGKTILTSVGSTIYENSTSNADNSMFRAGFVPAGYDHRPDLISNLFFGNSDNWWTVMEINGLSDPFESLNIQDEVRLPNG